MGVSEITDPLPKHWIIISSIDWSRNWQTHQQLATSLVAAGCRVLFIENTGVRAPRVGDLGRIRDRLRNWARSTRGFFDVRERLTVCSPLILPFPYFKIALWANRLLMSGALNKWMLVNRFHDPVLISFLPTPLAQGIIDDVDPVVTIYFNANDMAAGSRGAAALRRHEDAFLAKVDAVFCMSHALLERSRQLNNRVALIPPGVDFAAFDQARRSPTVPADLNALPRPIIGYVGSISAVFDQQLLVRAAQELPEASFVLVGPESADVSMLRTCRNIHFMGARPHAQIPQYIQAFDVALIPYVRNSFTEAVNACKLNEYLAMGTPVIATDLREIRLYAERHDGVLALTGTPEEFVAAIRSALGEQDESGKARRIAAARENSWDQRFSDIEHTVAAVLAAKRTQGSGWQNRLLGLYRRSRIRAMKAVFAVLTCYLLVFHTPLAWWAGNQLILREIPTSADAIVVFSGYGELGYENTGYLRRGSDALRLYRSGYAPRIVMSSRAGQAMAEAEVIRAVLLQNGVPNDAITIIGSRPASTYEDVNATAAVLKELGVRSMVFVTSPYHSRRAAMVWTKLAPDISMSVPATVGAPAPQPVWTTSVRTLRVIVFEYLAIAYYWVRGWL